MLQLQNNLDFDISTYQGTNVKSIQKAMDWIKECNMVIHHIEFKNSTCFFTWQCACCGKQSTVSASNLLKKNSQCLKCVHKQVKNDAKNTLTKKIKDLGFKVKSITKENLKQAVWKMECKNGHSFEKTGNRISKNFLEHNTMYCPHCWKSSCEEERVRAMLEHHFQKKFITAYPNWLINPSTNYPLELDMYCAELNLAIEYNGIHHYEPIYGEERFIETVEKDQLKEKLCKDYKVQLISIKGSDKHGSVTSKINCWANQFAQHGIVFSQDTLDYAATLEISSVKSDDASEKIRNKLAEFQMSWIDGTYINKTSSIKIQFDKCGHSVKKEVRHIRAMTKDNHFQCYRCSVMERQINAAKLLCVSRGLKFVKLNIIKEQVISIEALKDNEKVTVSEYAFTNFKSSNKISVR